MIHSEISRWARLGIVTGFLATIIYPTLIFAPLPDRLAVALAALWGPMLMIASLALYHVLAAYRRTIAAQIAVISNALAGALVTAMLLVQGATEKAWTDALTQAGDETAKNLVRASGAITWEVQLGLDVTWDVFISLGTFLFGLAMFSHPRFGKVVGSLGMVVGVSLFALNIWSFPTPPAEANLVDLGPAGGLWYFVVTLCLTSSLRWIDRQDAQVKVENTQHTRVPQS